MNAPPIIIGQDSQQLSANAQVTLDLEKFSGQGDKVSWLHHMSLYTTGDNDEPRIHIKPTDGPAWSLKAIPSYLLSNDYNSAENFAGSLKRFYLPDPVPMAPLGGFGISVVNGGSATPTFALSMIGHKDGSLDNLPEEWWSPRILWSRLTAVADQAQVRFDVDDLRNYGEEDIKVHSIVLREFADPFPNYDDVYLRVRIGGINLMQHHKKMPIGALIDDWRQEIPLHGHILQPNKQVEIELTNNYGSERNFDVAIIGSVKIRRSR